MYQAHFGLTDLPFRIAPDPRFYFEAAQYRAATSALVQGLQRGDEFMVLVGGVGAGKTTVMRRFLDRLDHVRFAYGEVGSSQLEGDELLRMAVRAFAIPEPHPDDPAATLQRWLGQLASAGHEAVLAIDEAQHLGLAALQRLQALCALRGGGGRGLLHVLLVGQEMPPALQASEGTGAPVTPGTVCRLGPLDAADTRAYVLHRLQRAGWAGAPAFPDAALAEIHRRSDGVPRRINLLCDRLLLRLYLDRLDSASGALVEAAGEGLAAELSGDAPGPAPPPPPRPAIVSAPPLKPLPLQIPVPVSLGVMFRPEPAQAAATPATSPWHERTPPEPSLALAPPHAQATPRRPAPWTTVLVGLSLVAAGALTAWQAARWTAPPRQPAPPETRLPAHVSAGTVRAPAAAAPAIAVPAAPVAAVARQAPSETPAAVVVVPLPAKPETARSAAAPPPSTSPVDGLEPAVGTSGTAAPRRAAARPARVAQGEVQGPMRTPERVPARAPATLPAGVRAPPEPDAAPTRPACTPAEASMGLCTAAPTAAGTAARAPACDAAHAALGLCDAP